MSAPPDTPGRAMSAPEPEPSHVRHIPIFVEGRDEPVVHRPEPAAPRPEPHRERDSFDDGPAFHPPPNFSRAFGTPFNKGFRGPQPFTQQKAFPQAAYARGASPQREPSPRPHDEHFAKASVHHEQAPPRPESRGPPPRPEPQQHGPPPPQRGPQPPRQASSPPPPREQTPPPKQTVPADPITLILGIQTDVLNLMSEVENFKGTKKDKKYMFLDEMLTRNLIKLDNIETDGKENIRLARKEAIRCIQKCIAVLEAKAEKGSAEAQARDVEMKDTPAENGDEDPKETKEEQPAEPQAGGAPAPVPEGPHPPEEALQPRPPADAAPAPNTRPADPTPGASAPDPAALPEAGSPKPVKRDESKNKVSSKDGPGEPGTQAEAGMEVDGAASQ